MIERPIIVGVDESPESVRAARAGWALARAIGAPCRLVHALPDLWLTGGMEQPVPPSMARRDVEAARRHLVATLRDVLPAEALAAIEVKSGRPAAVLADCAAGAQLVVVGGKPHGPLARSMGGSTAHSLVRTLDVPLLVVALTDWPPHRVLVAVDLSFAADATIAAARELARDTHAQVRVLHVVEPVRAARVGARVDQDAVYAEDLARFTRGGVTELAAGDRVVRRGAAADTVAAEAANWSADVVVVGSHGKGWVERMLIGSVTERLLALLPVSLLIVPVRPTEQSPWTRKESHAGAGAIAH